MSKDTSKYALSSAQARKNSKNSPWRTTPACQTKAAHESRARLDEINRTTQGQWNAYVESGDTYEERKARLSEVPESFRANALRHAQTVASIKKFHARKGIK